MRKGLAALRRAFSFTWGAVTATVAIILYVLFLIVVGLGGGLDLVKRINDTLDKEFNGE